MGLNKNIVNLKLDDIWILSYFFIDSDIWFMKDRDRVTILVLQE